MHSYVLRTRARLPNGEIINDALLTHVSWQHSWGVSLSVMTLLNVLLTLVRFVAHMVCSLRLFSPSEQTILICRLGTDWGER